MISEPLTLGAALLAGLLGSGHCLSMCGPIAALAGARREQRVVGRVLLYNCGRLLGYCAIGALFGALGVALGSAGLIADGSVVLRLGLALVLLLIGSQLLWPRLRANPLTRAAEWLGQRCWRRLAPLALRLQAGQRRSHLLLLGLLWGWLPCGLVYSMLALAAVSGTATNGALTMLAFGLGTLPAMIGTGLASRALGSVRTLRTQRVFGLALVLSGLWVAAMPLQHALAPPDQVHQHTQHTPEAMQ